MTVLGHFVLALINFTAENALPALFVVLLIEEAGIPIPVPGDILILLAGVAGVDRGFGFMLAALAVAVAATLAGSSILFVVMRHGGRRFVVRHGRIFRLGPKRIARMEGWFSRHHRHALLLGRLIPGLRIPTTALAGLSGLPYRRYLPAAAIAASLWAGAFLGLGVLVREEGSLLLPPLRDFVRTVTVPVLVLIAALVALNLLLGWLLLARRRLEAAEDVGLVPPAGTDASLPQTPHDAAAPSRTSAHDENGRAAASPPRERDRQLVS